MRTRFLGQAYQSRSPILASQTAINIYPESSEGNTEDVGAFYGTPGIETVFDPGISAPVRGMRTVFGKLYAVIGTSLYCIGGNYSGVLIGTVPGSARVSMIDNGSQLVIAHETGWVYVTLSTNAVAPVPNAPSGSIVTEQDLYVVFTAGDGTFGITALDDVSHIDPLDIATAEGLPDELVSVLSDHREEWLFGSESIEIWSNTGAAFFPFERSPGGFIEQGLAAMFARCKADNSVFWLSLDRTGHGVVYRANAYIPVRVSTHAIEYAINGYDDISDAFMFTQSQEGHEFVWVVFPSADATWVYDVATQAWHQRAWLDTETGQLHRHRANCFAVLNDDHLVGDYLNGKIYRMSLEIYTDDGSEIYRERAWDLPDSEMKRTRTDELELIVITGDGETDDTTITTTQPGPTNGFWDTGFWAPGFWSDGFWDNLTSQQTSVSIVSAPSEPQVFLQISRDGGRRWSYQRRVGLGMLGRTLTRARWRRLGYGRNVVFRVGTTMKNRVQWIGANVRGEVYQ